MKSQSLMAALSVLTVNMLLSLFFPAALSGDDCGGVTPALRIKAPERLEALSGSCLQIPCRYDATDRRYNSSKPIYGVWRKNWWTTSNNDIFHSSGSVNIYPLNLTGDLKNKDCTTLFPDLNTSYADKYFFRIENDPFKASACADSVQITVKDSAWSPSIKVSGDLKDLKEEESVSISCSARTPCPLSPPELTWSLQQVSQRQTETNPDGTVTTKIQENMTLSDTHDGSNITCSVRYPVDGGKRNKTAETNLTLSVSYAPKDTSASISPSGLVSAGSWVELSCSSRAKPPVRTFTWFKNCTGGPVNVSEGQVYRFNATAEGEYYCVARNDLGNQTSSEVFLDVGGTPQSPTIKVSGDLKEEESVSISCSARTPCPLSPPELTWSLQQVSQRQTETNPDGTVTTKIQEIMTLSDTHDGSNITCSVRYPVDGGKRNKTAETNLTLSVSYAPKDTSASISPSGLVSAGSWVELSCSSRAKPPVRTFTWFKNCTGGPVNVSQDQVYRFSITEGGEFFCVAANNLGVQTSPVVRLSVEGLVNGLFWVVIPVGIILLICLVVFVWWFKSKRRAPQQTQNQTGETVAAQNAANERVEELHYGEVKFIRTTQEASSVSVQDKEQVETVYADVKVSKPENSSAQTADSPEDLYAQVKKK